MILIFTSLNHSGRLRFSYSESRHNIQSGTTVHGRVPSNGVRLMEFDSFLQISFVVETLSF